MKRKRFRRAFAFTAILAVVLCSTFLLGSLPRVVRRPGVLVTTTTRLLPPAEWGIGETCYEEPGGGTGCNAYVFFERCVSVHER